MWELRCKNFSPIRDKNYFLKKDQKEILEKKSTITEYTIHWEGLNGRFELAEESRLEHRSTEIMQSEGQKEKKEEK